MDRQKYVLQNLKRYATLAELRRSEFYSECGAEIEGTLETAEICDCPGAEPLLHSFLRVVQWNIEKGIRFDEILHLFRNDEVLRWADVVLLNEADYGMARSGNRHVARCLAEALGMNLAFGPAHFELTKGEEDGREIAGDNEESLQGNAVLSRYPIAESCITSLPVCFEPYEFSEKRYGRRNCVWARLLTGSSPLWVGSIHLEVRKTPQCRAAQIGHLLEHLPVKAGDACLLGGDLNSNGFSRGTVWSTLRSSARLLLSPASKVMEELRHPENGREPLFQALSRRGFSWQDLNSWEDTSCALIAGLEDASLLPEVVVSMIRKRLRPYGGHLCFKLDWFLGRHVHGLARGELRDTQAGVISLAPGCIRTERSGPDRISDHFPIFADLRV